ncbi:MAG: DUF4280 domain-containing protein [Clostridiales bacterium]|nr:DUF4280 domain-containing protein [Clostridiales bacterium]
MAKEYVYMGAKLKCPFGSAESKLMMTPQHRVQTGTKLKANIGDAKPFVNIMPFGQCKSMANPTVAAATAAAQGKLQPMPCTPVCTVWFGGKANQMVDKMPALMNDDKLMCSFGQGVIEIKDSGQGGSKKGKSSGPLPIPNDKGESKGGSYKECKKSSDGSTEEVHHMPADSASKLKTGDGPAITMDKADHQKTASYDNKPGSKDYRDAQRKLIEQGKFKEAMQMDVKDILGKFPGKYDKHIEAALKYADELASKGVI